MNLWVINIAIGALTYSAEDPRFEIHFEQRVGHSPTVHPAADRDLVETLGEMKAATKGPGQPSSQSRWPRTTVFSNRQSPTYRSYMGLTFTSYELTGIPN